jgi:STE24 endopeptidase
MNSYLAVILAILVGAYLLDLIADLLNLRCIRPDLPDEFKGVYDAGRYRKSQDYLRDSTRLDLIAGGIMTAATVAFILCGGFAAVDRFARSFGMGEIATGLFFAALLLLLSQACRIPFSAYRTFVIEARYGFNRTTAATFFSDILRKWLLGALIGGALFSAIVWLFGEAGSAAWLYCWGVIAAAQLFLVFVAPVVIMPLFNTFTPLEEGELRAAIERYARSQGFALRGIFTMDASRRTGKSNAFFTGFGRYRRIVLFDTLVRKHTAEELVAILAHEVGHYKRKHVLASMLIMLGVTGLMLLLLSLFINNRGLFDAFGVRDLSVYASVFLFGFLVIPIQRAISLLTNAVSRRHEYRADAFAAETCGRPESVIAALEKLSVDNLANLTPHPIKVVLDYSHPPVLERIRRLRGRCR